MHRLVRNLIAYTFAFASAILACTYGFMSAVGFVAYGKAFVLCLVAFGGCHGPAYVSYLRKTAGIAWAALAFVATLFCLLVTLWGGLGTISSGSAEVRAERQKAAGDRARDEAALARLRLERDKIGAPRPAGAIQADLATARAAPAYKISDSCNPEEIKSKPAREHCAGFRKLEAELAGALEAGRLDAEVAAVSARLAHAPADLELDPQAAAFSRLTGVTLEMSAALYALAASIALELMGMVAMMVAWSNSTANVPQTVAASPARQEPRQVERGDIPPRAPRPAQTNVVPIPKPAVYGSIKKFVLACVHPAPGERVQVRAVFARYLEWCKEGGLPPAGLDRFLDGLEAVCRKAGLEIEPDGGQVYVVGVRLAA